MTQMSQSEIAGVYLYSGPMAMRPIIFSTDEFFAPECLKDAVTHMGEVSRTILVQYWWAPDDFENECPKVALRAEDLLGACGLPCQSFTPARMVACISIPLAVCSSQERRRAL